MPHTTQKTAKHRKRQRENSATDKMTEDQQARFYAALVREGYLLVTPDWTTQPLRV